MEQNKRRRIEEKLRKMFVLANQSQEDSPSKKSRPRGVRVIRRRKGLPDMQIA